jgi:hypothetical protein
MDQFRFVGRICRSNENTRLSGRAPQLRSTLSLLPLLFTPLTAACLLVTARPSFAEEQGKPEKKWAATWTTAPQDIFKGSTTPALVNFAFPNPVTDGANNQTLRMIVKPDLWGNTIRLRFSNTWGTQPVTFGRVTVALQSFSGNLLPATNTPVTFSGHPSVTIPVGQEIFSDPVFLRWVEMSDDEREAVDPVIDGHNLAVSIFVQGKSGPMTYHSTALAEILSQPAECGRSDRSG